jgi:hypothetical protein
MSLPVRAFAGLLLVLCAVACSAGNTAAPSVSGTDGLVFEIQVEPEEVLERLLTQLRDEDYSAAYDTLSTGQARDVADDGLDLQTKLEAANTLVREWTLEKRTYFDTVDGFSMTEVGGTVTFEDGGTGRARVVMNAQGLQADPWRVNEFELTRD